MSFITNIRLAFAFALLLHMCTMTSALPIPALLPRAPSSPKPWPSNIEDIGTSFGISRNVNTPSSELREDGNSTVLVGKYPRGSYAGANIAGFTFNAKTNQDLTTAKEVVLTYDIKFQDEFAWANGGKIPGLFGGDTFDLGVTCAGGHHDDRCWSARLMWRDGGKGELYGYFPSANKDSPFCKGQCGNHYGASLDTGAWTFTAGKWVTLQQRVLLNDVGEANGEIEVSVDGESVISKEGITLRTSNKGGIQGVMVHTFFGGSSSPKFQSPKEQEASFRNFHVEIKQRLPPKSRRR